MTASPSTAPTTPQRHLDGNAPAGAMAQLFGGDLTDAMGTCTMCGRRAAMGEARAYVDAPGVVLRCGGCDNLLVRWVTTSSTTWLHMPGLRSLEIAARP